MAKKFKAGLMGGEGGSGRREDSNKEHSSFPGDKLPEHHFKKKYFNAEFQRQQGEQERREGRGREEEEERRRVCSQSGGQPPRDHRYEQAMRAHFEGQARPQGSGGPQEQGGNGPRPQGPHFRGVPYTETPRQRPQMFPGGPQGYPGPPHYNPQQAMAMQAMAYRHQMMYGRPPHPGPPPTEDLHLRAPRVIQDLHIITH